MYPLSASYAVSPAKLIALYLWGVLLFWGVIGTVLLLGGAPSQHSPVHTLVRLALGLAALWPVICVWIIIGAVCILVRRWRRI